MFIVAHDRLGYMTGMTRFIRKNLFDNAHQYVITA